VSSGGDWSGSGGRNRRRHKSPTDTHSPGCPPAGDPGASCPLATAHSAPTGITTELCTYCITGKTQSQKRKWAQAPTSRDPLSELHHTRGKRRGSGGSAAGGASWRRQHDGEPVGTGGAESSSRAQDQRGGIRVGQG
jgi:hypothetical protein